MNRAAPLPSARASELLAELARLMAPPIAEEIRLGRLPSDRSIRETVSFQADHVAGLLESAIHAELERLDSADPTPEEDTPCR